MIGLWIDQETNDLALDDVGHLRLAVGTEAVGQHARQRLMTFRGEWFLDPNAGVEHFDRLIGRAFDRDLAEALLAAEAAGTPGVAGIDGMSVAFERPTGGLRVRDLQIVPEDGL